MTLLAISGAALMIAHQVAAKAARDSLFLTEFDVTALPAMMGVAALFAVLAGVLFGRLMTRLGPIVVLPFGLLVSVSLHILEFFLIGFWPRPIVVVSYLHIVGFGAILLSAFWSVASEAFDPREAKRVFGRITGGGTAGGVIGGLLAERIATMAGTSSLLVLLALLHLSAAGVFFVLRRSNPPRVATSEQTLSFSRTAIQAIQRAPFLRNLAILVLLSTISAALLDYLFKSGAAQTFGKGAGLARFFALFYTSTQIIAFIVQAGISPWILRSLGLGRTVMVLPLTVFGGACASLLFPVFPVRTLVRGFEAILRTSLFRSGYELFFTPIPPTEKRAVKTAIDVGCDRLGDAFGAMVLQLLLLFGPHRSFAPILFVTAVFALICVAITRRMDRAYLDVLEHGLLNRAVELDRGEVSDATTLLGFSRVMPAVQPSSVETPVIQGALTVQPQQATPSAAGALDASMQRLQELRTRDAVRINRALQNPQHDALIVPQVIRLLAWNEVKTAARIHLERNVDKSCGQLLDALLDTEQDFAIRRRIPRVLSSSKQQRVVNGLVEALSDPRFEIRFASSRALESIHRQQPDLKFDAERLMQIVTRELSVSKNIWEGRRLLDQRDEADSQYIYLDEVLKDRANYSLEHVFSLLAIFVPREPLKVAFRALHSDDPLLRGLGLEYLETTLTPDVFNHLSALVEASPTQPLSRDPEQVLDELMAQDSIQFQVKSQVTPKPA